MTLIETSDLGTIEMPPHAAWCDQEQHQQYADDGKGCYEAADMTTCTTRTFEFVLPEIRNGASGRVERDGSSRWLAHVHRSRLEPSDGAKAWFSGPPLVALHVVSALGLNEYATIDMTTGEARVLIAHLTALVDSADLAR